MSHSLPRATKNQYPSNANTRVRDDLFKTLVGTRLSAAIEGLYFAYGHSGLGKPLNCCPHCYTDSDRIYLETTPLRQLTWADAATILPDSTYTLGTAADLNYFLPRILEAHAYHAHYLPETIGKKLGLAREAGWTSEQLDVVLEFMRAYFAAANALEYNDSLYYDYEYMRADLREALPELTEEMHLVDPDAVLPD